MPINGQWMFGTTQKMQMLRIPTSGMTRNRVRYASDMQFENGGGDVYQPSMAYHYEYGINFGTYEASGGSGLDRYADYARGEYGTGLIYFADPMAFDTNMLPANFANPSLSQYGWKSIGGTTATSTYAATAANAYNQPGFTASITLPSTTPLNTHPSSSSASVIIPIPTGYVLWLGASGSVTTGTPVVRAEAWVNGAASAAATSNLTLLSATASTRLNASFSSASYNYVKLGLAITSAVTGTIALTSMMAVMYPIGVTPTSTVQQFTSGQGANGCKFTTDAVADSYTLYDPSRPVHLKGLAFGMKEVGPWQ